MTLHKNSRDAEKRIRRSTKPAEQRKTEWITFAVEPSRAAAYRLAAEAGHYGVMSYFARAACDALAAQHGHPVPPSLNSSNKD